MPEDNKIPRYTMRISATLMEKLRFVAAYNGRSTNKELEWLVRMHVAEFEKQHGPIAGDKRTDG